MDKEWYQYKNFWRRGDGDDDHSPQDRRDGTGDLIFNTLTKIIEDNDTSEWAVNAFITCAELLLVCKRWPNEFNTGNEAESMFGYWVHRLFGGTRLTKPQSRMSRDPYVAFYACYFHLLGSKDDERDIVLADTFKMVRIPGYLYSPATWRWVRKLREDNQEHYVKRLDYYRALAVTIKFKKFYEDKFHQNT